VDAPCPRCSSSSTSIQTTFGVRDFTVYRIGDFIRWNGKRAVRNGGRPPDGTMRAKAFFHCSSCGAGLFLYVLVADDRLVGIVPDSWREPTERDWSSSFIGEILDPSTGAWRPAD
jgi:hypothetical protein